MKIAQNIYEIPYGYRVLISRPGIKFDVFIRFGKVGGRTSAKPAALARAIAERDRFLALHGRTYSGQQPRSNTGISGISEVTKWFHNRPLDCFQVTIARSQRIHPKRFAFRHAAGREPALRAAIAWRSRHTGEDPAQLLNQAKEALCV